MMEWLTVGQVVAAVAALAGFVKGVEYLWRKARAATTKWVQGMLAPINQKLDDVDMGACKDFLVDFLSDVEQGKEMDEVMKERFYERYSHYKALGGNSYIHDKVERLKKAGKI